MTEQELQEAYKATPEYLAYTHELNNLAVLAYDLRLLQQDVNTAKSRVQNANTDYLCTPEFIAYSDFFSYKRQVRKAKND